jgi:hypothetical protein
MATLLICLRHDQLQAKWSLACLGSVRIGCHLAAQAASQADPVYRREVKTCLYTIDYEVVVKALAVNDNLTNNRSGGRASSGARFGE